MQMLRNKKAISTLIWVVLLLCSFIAGAFTSYLWVMSSYYNMPEESALLLVENAAFQATDMTYFNVTILNPSNSVLDANMTAIRVTVEGKNKEYNITSAEPQLPFVMRKGTRQTFKCKRNWSEFAGESVRVRPIAAGASTTSYPVTTPNVKLTITPAFDASRTIRNFTIVVKNLIESVINLTVTDILMFSESLNVTPTLPKLLQPNQEQTFHCNRNWEDMRAQNATIAVKTAEGYESTYTTSKLQGAVLKIDRIWFPLTSTKVFYVNVTSSGDSTAKAMVNRINVTLHDGTIIPINTTFPLPNTLQSQIAGNETRQFMCNWNWTQLRNENMTVNVYTREGFKIPSKWQITPPAVVWNITDAKFDLDDTGHFSVNITNMGCSTHAINVATIRVNQTAATMIPPSTTVNPNEQKTLNCTYDWKNSTGKSITLTAFAQDGMNVSKVVTIPSIGLKLLGDSFAYGDLNDPARNVTTPYFNVTVSNSVNSLRNATITRIILQHGNGTFTIYDNSTHPIGYSVLYPRLNETGYLLRVGQAVTLMCYWDYPSHLSPSPVTVTVYTREGIETSKTWPASSP